MEQGYKSLIVWKKSIELVKEIYKIGESLPRREQFGLVSQICRAAVSVPSNIAEGNKRGSRKEYVQFLRIAHGSLAELETQLVIISELYPEISIETASMLSDEVSRMLSAIIKKLHV
ncbi:MAG: four helix bundle protein [Candidatus Pacebacteria bacterium]|nr:four helix bundle protein [Candidatus Paceibacterota bacterium]